MRTSIAPHVVALVLALGTLLVATATHAGDDEPWDVAVRLEREGRLSEAFEAYLQVPGAEHLAVRLGRRAPETSLARVRDLLAAAPSAERERRLRLVDADLCLAAGDAEAALRGYREVAERLDHEGPEAPHYVVEPPADGPASRRVLAPFEIGPGSHRDNWLLRRFLALEAWPEARAEFERVWAFHRSVVDGRGFTGPGLQFAIDLAFFWRRRGDDERARAVLLEPLGRIDLDRVPASSAVQAGGRWGRRYAGISRKEYVRLVHGAFRSEGREAELVSALEREIDAGNAAAWRVLARLHVHAGRLDEALACELAYVEPGRFDERSAAVRRGHALEAARRFDDAVRAYEAALAAPAGPLDLPEPDEEERGGALAAFVWTPLVQQDAWRLDVLRRLERIHVAAGRTDAALDCALRLLDEDPWARRDFRTVEEAGARFRAGGHADEFAAWLGRQRDDPDAIVRANAAWLQGDAAAAIQHVVAARTALGRGGLAAWAQRFRDHEDPGTWAAFLEARVAADPADGAARLTRLATRDMLEGDEAVRLYEDLIAGRAAIDFETRYRPWAPEHLEGFGDVAYRLARLYLARGDAAAVVGLALSILREEGPFAAAAQELRPEYRDGNGPQERWNAVLALAVQTASTEEDLDRLGAALAQGPWVGARHQLARRRAAAWPPEGDAPAFGWSGLPEGVRLLACNEDVLALAKDEAHVYAGHPWGVAVYDLSGRPLTRVALGAAAQDLATGAGACWAATPFGVFRVDAKTFAVQWLPGDQDLNPAQQAREDAEVGRRGHAAQAVLFHDGRLWIATARDVRTYDPASKALRIYSADELSTSDTRDWFGFVVDEGVLWAEGRDGVRRYDAGHDAWSAPTLDGEARPVHLLGRSGDVLYGDVRLVREQDHRVCRLRVLAAERGGPPRVEADVVAVDVSVRDHFERRGMSVGHGPWSLYGTVEGSPVFGMDAPLVSWDAASDTLRLLPEDTAPASSLVGILQPGLERTILRPRAQGLWRWEPRTGDGRVTFGGFRARDGAAMGLGDGALVLGGRATAWRHEYPREDWPPQGEHPREQDPGLGGLWFFPREGEGRRVSREAPADALPSDRVLDVAVGPDGDLWLATEAGLVVVDEALRVRAALGRAEGLVADRFDAVLALGGTLYAGSSWSDRGGGLTVFDPVTRVFTSLHPADGLATDRIAGLTVADGKLGIRYGIQYRRWSRSYGYQRCPPTVYDPPSGTFTTAAEPERAARAEDLGFPPRPDAYAPLLGGYATRRLSWGEREVIATTHGVVVRPRAQGDVASFPTLEVVVPGGQPFQLERTARERLFRGRGHEDLEAVLADPNPYVAALFLEHGAQVRPWPPEAARLVAPYLGDERLLVRRAAARFLATSPHADVAPGLRAALDDADQVVREQVALGLARLGEVPDVTIFARWFAREGRGQAYSSAFPVYEALAEVPTPDVVRLLLEYPLPTDDYEPRLRVMARMGEALAAHPLSVDLLLAARRAKDSAFDPPTFAQVVLAGGGEALKPLLLQAIRSPDRVVRANAAGALGRMGDPTSIPDLVQALDLESGLSRRAIVEALARLGAREALPRLAPLYVDAVHDQRGRAGTGFLVAQAAAVDQAVYETMPSLESLGRDWEELEARAGRAPVPVLDEPLLEPETILQAVAAIGGEAAQPFWRQVAAEADADARAEAARQLVGGGEDDRAENLAVLQSLTTARDLPVRVAAGVSLWILGQPEPESAIRGWLAGGTRWEWNLTVREMARVEDAARLAPFRAELQALERNADLDRFEREAVLRLLARMGP